MIMMLGEDVVEAVNSCYIRSKRDEIQVEMDRYQAKMGISKNNRSLEMVKGNGSKYSILSFMAKKYLGILATSVPCERLFSAAGQIITKNKARMTPRTCEMMVFMKA